MPHGSDRANAMKLSASTLKATPFDWGTIGWSSLTSKSASVVCPPSAEIWSGPPSKPVAQKSYSPTGSNPRCSAYHRAASARSGTRMCT